jgi:hypothetical protein
MPVARYADESFDSQSSANSSSNDKTDTTSGNTNSAGRVDRGTGGQGSEKPHTSPSETNTGRVSENRDTANKVFPSEINLSGGKSGLRNVCAIPNDSRNIIDKSKSTLEPYRGGIRCEKFITEKNIIQEPLRCGLEELGQSVYERNIGVDCTKENSAGQVLERIPKYVVPNSETWKGCRDSPGSAIP